MKIEGDIHFFAILYSFSSSCDKIKSNNKIDIFRLHSLKGARLQYATEKRKQSNNQSACTAVLSQKKIECHSPRI